MRHPPTIGVLAPLLGGFYFGSLLTSVRQIAQRHGYRVVAIQTQTENSTSGQPPFRDTLAWDQVDGWVVILEPVEAVYLQSLQRTGKPIVTLSALFPDLACPAVLPDNIQGMVAAVRHLLDHGHTRVAFVGNPAHEDIRQRYEGYQAALRAYGVTPDPALFFPVTDNAISGGYDAARRLLAAGMPCTALAAATDFNAIGIMEVLAAAGYRLPDDLAIVGFDDIERAQYARPPLTSVRQRFDKLGSTAAQLLLAQIAGEHVPTGPIYSPTALIQRGSCGCSVTGVLQLEAAEHQYTSPDWQQALAHQLVRLAIFPLDPDPEARPDQIWPGVEQLVALVARIVEGGDQETSETRTPFWEQAVALTPALDGLYALIALLDRAGTQRLDMAPDAAAREHLRAFLEQARLDVAQIRLGREVVRNSFLEDVIQENRAVSLALLRTGLEGTRTLDWLGRSNVHRGYLGLW